MTTKPLGFNRSEPGPWPWLAVLLVGLTLLSGARWMLTQPFSIHSDEAWYVNEAQIDVQAFHTGGLHQLARWIIHGDPNRPPAYRLVVLPFMVLFGYHTFAARLVTIACFLLSGWLIYLTTARFAGSKAAILAFLVFSLSPGTLQQCIFFSTEGPLYVAVSGMLYFGSIYWTDEPEPWGNFIGLGLAIGVGLLSKATFLSVLLPLFGACLITAFFRRRGIWAFVSLAMAAVLGTLIAAPWWLANFRSGWDYAFFGNQVWSRHIRTWMQWFYDVLTSLLGPGIALLIILLLIVYLRKAFAEKRSILTPNQRTALFACACAGIPLTLAQLAGTNYNLRLISASVMPLAIAVGILSVASGWVRSKTAMVATGTLFAAQVLMLGFPVVFPNIHPVDPTINGYPWSVMIRFEQWDWKPLKDISESCGATAPRLSFIEGGRALDGHIQYGWVNPTAVPKISYLGNGRAFNGSQIQYPWLQQGLAFPDVTWLWRYEEGPMDWQKVMSAVDRSDIALTAPGYIGQITDHEDEDNQHNAEFAARLESDPNFQQPVHLKMGRLDPVDVEVFLNRSLTCR